MYPKSMQLLIEDLKGLPGVGEKTAERYALSLLNKPQEEIEQIAHDLLDAKNKIKYCRVCGNMTEDEICDICKDPKRDQSVICVVQEPKDIIAIERTKYNGLYHVLNGVISTTKGILPEDINIAGLLKRIDEKVKEIIVATNPTLDGETTAIYLTKILKNKNVSVSRLANGIPMGGNLDYADELTLIKAMEGRIKQ